LFEDAEGRTVYVRVGKNGPYLERTVTGDDGEPTPQRANLSDSLTPDELTLEVAEELFATPKKVVSWDWIRKPATRLSPRRPVRTYVTEVLPKPDDDGRLTRAPRRARSPRVPSPGRIAVAQHGVTDGHPRRRAEAASLPRVVGVDPASSEEITAQNGRYGPT